MDPLQILFSPAAVDLDLHTVCAPPPYLSSKSGNSPAAMCFPVRHHLTEQTHTHMWHVLPSSPTSFRPSQQCLPLKGTAFGFEPGLTPGVPPFPPSGDPSPRG
eukprot:scaffold840_cov344-Pavlova_lutheri.AAC.63